LYEGGVKGYRNLLYAVRKLLAVKISVNVYAENFGDHSQRYVDLWLYLQEKQ